MLLITLKGVLKGTRGGTRSAPKKRHSEGLSEYEVYVRAQAEQAALARARVMGTRAHVHAHARSLEDHDPRFVLAPRVVESRVESRFGWRTTGSGF